jgi:hypothetical protein
VCAARFYTFTTTCFQFEPPAPKPAFLLAYFDDDVFSLKFSSLIAVEFHLCGSDGAEEAGELFIRGGYMQWGIYTYFIIELLSQFQ